MEILFIGGSWDGVIRDVTDYPVYLTHKKHPKCLPPSDDIEKYEFISDRMSDGFGAHYKLIN